MRMQLMLDPFFPAWGLVPRSAAKSEEKTGPELDYDFYYSAIIPVNSRKA